MLPFARRIATVVAVPSAAHRMEGGMHSGCGPDAGATHDGTHDVGAFGHRHGTPSAARYPAAAQHGTAAAVPTLAAPPTLVALTGPARDARRLAPFGPAPEPESPPPKG